nr:uncharacterized protein LOC107034488 [Vicugna pacos]
MCSSPLPSHAGAIAIVILQKKKFIEKMDFPNNEKNDDAHSGSDSGNLAPLREGRDQDLRKRKSCSRRILHPASQSSCGLSALLPWPFLLEADDVRPVPRWPPGLPRPACVRPHRSASRAPTLTRSSRPRPPTRPGCARGSAAQGAPRGLALPPGSFSGTGSAAGAMEGPGTSWQFPVTPLVPRQQAVKINRYYLCKFYKTDERMVLIALQ